MSTLSVTTIKSKAALTPPVVNDSAGTEVGTFCRAWVNFNGTGTVAIRASFNVTSITDNNTGDYRVNFTSALADASYAVVADTSVASFVRIGDGTMTTTACSLLTYNSAVASTDFSQIYVALFR